MSESGRSPAIRRRRKRGVALIHRGGQVVSAWASAKRTGRTWLVPPLERAWAKNLAALQARAAPLLPSPAAPPPPGGQGRGGRCRRGRGRRRRFRRGWRRLRAAAPARELLEERLEKASARHVERPARGGNALSGERRRRSEQAVRAGGEAHERPLRAILRLVRGLPLRGRAPPFTSDHVHLAAAHTQDALVEARVLPRAVARLA